MAKPHSVVRVYACGGAGTNIASSMESLRNGGDCYAAVDIAYVDTSDSNIRSGRLIPSTQHFHILDEDGKPLDGAGQQRRDILPHVESSMGDILSQFKPADFNIVLFSAAGGSGSMIGPAIINALLVRDVPVVAVVVGSDATRTYAQNTLGTIKTLDAISEKNGRPIIVAYTQNTAERLRSVNDTWAAKYVMGLAVLFSGMNLELDSRDLHNFLRLDKVAAAYRDQRLVSLTLLQGGDRLDDTFIGPITVASLARSIETIEKCRFATTPKYQVSGILPETQEAQALSGQEPYHYVTSVGFIESVTRGLQQVIERIDAEDAPALSQQPIRSSADKKEGGIFCF